MRSVLTLAVVLTVCVLAQADVPQWGEIPQVYSVDGDAVLVSDGGGSTGDLYLLTADKLSDFALSFDITRLEAGGDKLRAIVVWGVGEDRANRDAFFLPCERFQPGTTYHVEVAKVGDTVTLKLDGDVISRSPVRYGEPQATGYVGLLHYYNYHFGYENMSLLPLDPEAVPAPTGLAATVEPDGVVSLSWEMGEGYADLLNYQVRRRAEGEAEQVVATTTAQTALDRTAAVGVAYSYRVCAAFGEQTGPLSAPLAVRLATGLPPYPVKGLRAVSRIDGSTRITWRPAGAGRCAGYRVLRGAQVIADSLAAAQTSVLAPPGEVQDYQVLALNPDGEPHVPAAVAATPSAPEVSATGGIPDRHPYLLYSSLEMLRARQAAADSKEAAEVIASVCRDADSKISAPLAIPRERTDDHNKMYGPIQRVAEAYALSGDDKYAAWVREALLVYADLYPTFAPQGGGRARIFKTASGLYEAMWFVPIVCAYDMVCESPVLSAEDRRKIETNLLRPGADMFRVQDYSDLKDYRAGDLHYKCYNFQAWFISAVGLTGLVLRDPELVEHAIDGPYGFKHLLAHDIHDDGIFWERSFGYHSFVLIALLPFLQAAYHCNLDLWNVQVPDDYNEDREPLANYTVGDGDNGPKSIRLMLDGPLYALYGDRTHAAFGDSGPGPLSASSYYRAAYHHFRDPRYAWLYWQGRKPAASTGAHRGEADLSGTVRAAYDARHLYLCAEITDDLVRNTWADPAQAWQGDLLWVGLKWAGNDAAGYDLIYGLTPGDGANVPPQPVAFNRFQTVSHALSSGAYKVRRTETGYVLEIAIPWADFAPRGDEKGVAFTPAEGAALTTEFVLYDGDPREGSSTKEKMLAWSSTTDRYNVAEGGKLVLGQAAPDGQRAINAPRAAALQAGGNLPDWDALPCVKAQIGLGSAVMTDSSSGADLLSLIYEEPSPEGAALRYDGTGFGNNGVLQQGCSLYPSTGFAVLRERLGADGFVPLDATCCTLSFGPHGGGHGHSDKLNLVVYADGKQWLPDFSSCPYESSEKTTWTSQTISHNTVVLDQTSQYPTIAGSPMWPCDSSDRQARSRLGFFHCDDLLKVADGYNDVVYKGVRLRRTVAVVGESVIDFMEVAADAEHTIDYPLHIDGPLLESSVVLTGREGVFADLPGYKHIDEVRGGAADAAVTTLWGDAARKLRVSAAGAAGTEVFVARGITSALDHHMPMLILRRSAQRSVFATVMQPYTAEAPAAPEWLQTPENVAAVRVPTGEGTVLVVLNGSGAPVVVDGLQATGRIAARLTRPDGTTRETIVSE